MQMPSNVYDVLKWILLVVVDAFILLLTTLQKAWGWDIPIEAIVITITAVSTFLGVCTGISNYNYNKQLSIGDDEDDDPDYDEEWSEKEVV